MADKHYLDELANLWISVKESFKDKNGEGLSDTTVSLWFDDVKVVGYEEQADDQGRDILTLGIENPFKYRQIQNKFLDKINKAFNDFLGFEIRVILVKTGDPTSAETFSTPIPKAEEKKEINPIEQTISDSSVMPIYNFEYTFENFIVGGTNTFAHAACLSIANNPFANNYNPLFIYGNSGLGKTHLMCAIVNRLKQNYPNIKIIYSKCEDFTNQMISCLASKTMEEFRDKYRKCDVLLIDDVQFIAGKTSTQEEFFNTFNALFEEKKQIIFTSDRPPKDINPLEERIRSRFEWGLLADIEPPDLELRIAIIKKKAEQVNVSLSTEVMTYLGENLRSNIRQIEGTIKKLAAISFLSGSTVTMEVARKCITDIYGGTEPINVTLDKIFSAVYRKYNISKEDITGKKRTKEIANARHITIYLIRTLTEMSYSNIAKIFSRDHATIMSSCETITHKKISNASFSTELNDLQKEITDH